MTTYSALPLLALVVLAGCASGTAKAPAPPAPAASEDPVAADGRALTAAFLRGDTHAIWERFSPQLRELNKGDEKNFVSFRVSAETQLGTLQEKVSERVEIESGYTKYVQLARFTKVGTPVEIAFGVDPKKTIVMFVVRLDPHAANAAAPTTKLAYQTRAALRLPFDGTWDVAWGGRTLAENQHVVVSNQRFAYDFLVMENGQTHRGDGARNEDYFAYGRPILAPAAGTVVGIANDVPENAPGKLATASLAGNFVVLDHGSGEYSLLAHLQPGSVTVAIGDRVTPRQLLGRCGNSGHSSEPHLHYHLQDAPTVGDGAGLPAQFVGYTKGSEVVTRGEPVRGDRIAITLR